MRVSTLVRSTATLLALAIMAACSDSAVAPRATTSMSADRVSAPTLKKDGKSVEVKDLGDGRVSFTIDPSKAQNVQLGNHTISFPTYSICDPRRASYGEAYWDAPCAAATRPVTFTAEWKDRNGYAYIEFEPAVRFVPASAHDTDRWVVLSLKQSKTLDHDDDFYAILWEGGKDKWVDESASDPSPK